MNREDKELLENNKHILDSEIKRDIIDTEKEIKAYELLSETSPNQKRIYDLKISVRKSFVIKIKRILELREMIHKELTKL